MEFTRMKRNATFAVSETNAAQIRMARAMVCRMPYQLLDLCLFEVKFRICICICNNNRRNVLCVNVSICIVVLCTDIDVVTLTICSCTVNVHDDEYDVYNLVHFSTSINKRALCEFQSNIIQQMGKFGRRAREANTEQIINKNTYAHRTQYINIWHT